MSTASVATPSLTSFDLHLLAEGHHYRSFEKLGAHPAELDGEQGVRFAVWAPNASSVDVIGDFNDWQAGAAPLTLREDAGVWEGFVRGVGEGTCYKYRVASRLNGPGALDTMLVVCHFTPVPRLDEPVGVPAGGYWRELLNSDAADYGGSGIGNLGGVMAVDQPHHGRPCHLRISAPPLGVVVFAPGERP